MGRTGETFWAFQGQNAVPDIITVGKPLGNGHPIGAVITSRKIAATIKSAEHIVSSQVLFAFFPHPFITTFRNIFIRTYLLQAYKKSKLKSLNTSSKCFLTNK